MSRLSLMVLAPALAAALLLLVPNTQRLAVRWIALLGALVPLAVSIACAFWYDRAAGGVQLAESLPLVPSLQIFWSLGIDGWGVALNLLTGIIITTGVLASWTMKEREKEFYVLLLVLVAGVFGVFSSQDLFVFFLL